MYPGIRILGKPKNTLSDEAFTVYEQQIKELLEHPITYRGSTELVGFAEAKTTNDYANMDPLEGVYDLVAREDTIVVVPISNVDGSIAPIENGNIRTNRYSKINVNEKGIVTNDRLILQ